MHVSSWLYFLQQGLLTLCLLLALQRAACLHRPGLPRLLLTALIESAGLLLACVASDSWVRCLLLLPTLLTPFAVWPGLPRRLRIRLPLIFVGLALLLSGWARLLLSWGLPSRLLVPLCCVMLVVLPSLPWRAHAACTSVRIVCGQRSVTLTALIDSGNLLRDRFSGLPVIVISRRAALGLMDTQTLFSPLPQMRMMQVRTVAGTAMMTVFQPDTLKLQVEAQGAGAGNKQVEVKARSAEVFEL